MLKFGACVTPITVSTVLVVMAGSLMPTLAAWLLITAGPMVAVGLLLGAGERTACQILLGARRLTPTELKALAPAVAILSRNRLGPPFIELAGHTRSTVAVHAHGVGRRTVILSAGLVRAARLQQLPPQEIAAVIAHSATSVRARAVRHDLVLRYWALPWKVACLAVVGIGRCLWPLRPVLSAGWALRALPAIVAAVQSAQQGYPAIAVAIVTLLVVTYAHPWAERAWARHLEDLGDQGVIDAGFAGPLADFLSRLPPTVRLDERTYRLDQHREAPSLGRHLHLVP